MDARERFVAAVNGSPDDVPLDVAAFCIAAHAHRGLDVDEWVQRIDTIATRCPDSTFDALRTQLFEHDGFHGDLANYADPENSFLDSVIERRRGIPISLSVLMIAVGRRLGVDVQGVGMPGHFLVLDAARGDRWCDPFHGGALLDADGCRHRFDLVYGGTLQFHRSFLDPTPPPAIVARMLANLERGELANDPVQRAWMCELHLAIPGISFPEQWELADQLARTGDMMRAAAEYDRLAARIESSGSDPDAASERLRTRARSLRARLN
jgi:regulator of sirC expression with transglutaminase-like and TPR domain